MKKSDVIKYLKSKIYQVKNSDKDNITKQIIISSLNNAILCLKEDL